MTQFTMAAQRQLGQHPLAADTLMTDVDVQGSVFSIWHLCRSVFVFECNKLQVKAKEQCPGESTGAMPTVIPGAMHIM